MCAPAETLTKNRALVLNTEAAPDPAQTPATCGWLLSRKNGARGPGDAIIIGPGLRKTRLIMQEDLVTRWIKDAPRNSTLWTPSSRKLLPKLLFVTEEWSCPSWTRITWGGVDIDPGPTAVGLSMSAPTSAPLWRHLSLSKETVTSFRLGNTSVILLFSTC